jgi:hypothetical protein
MSRRAGVALLLLLVSVAPVLADVIPPFPFNLFPQPRHDPRQWRDPLAPPHTEPLVVPLVIKVPAETDKQTYLRLPAAMRSYCAEAAPDNGSTRRASASPTRLTTLVAGLALAMCFTLCGVRFIRSGNRRFLYGGVALAFAVFAIGLSGCPDELVVYNPTIVNTLGPLTPKADGTLMGQALLRQDDKDNGVELTINREELAAFLEKNAPTTPER